MIKVNAEQEQKILDMKENDIINALLGEREIPTATVIVDLDKNKGISIPIVLKGLTRKEMDRIKKAATKKRKIKGVFEEKIDSAEYDAGVVVGATTNFDWENPKLLDSVSASDGKQFLMKKLLAGEINALAGKVLELSGFDDELEEAEDIKNLSAEEQE